LVAHTHTILPILGVALLCAQAGRTEVHGYRADYSDAEPPTNWTRRVNVRWTAYLPSVGGSNPIILGERLYVTAEPDRLLCLDTEDGEQVWEQRNSLHTVLSPGEQELSAWDVPTEPAAKPETAHR